MYGLLLQVPHVRDLVHDGHEEVDSGVQDGVELAEALDDDCSFLRDDLYADVGRAGRDGEVPQRSVVGSRDGGEDAKNCIVLGECEGACVPAESGGGGACESIGQRR